jgi:hypothetical protein
VDGISGGIFKEIAESEDFLNKNGEPSRARTCDPLIKSQLLYQLSYRPLSELKLYVRNNQCQARLKIDSSPAVNRIRP